MTFLETYLQGLLLIFVFVTFVWMLSVYLKNASIVDIFWGLGFVMVSSFYFIVTPDLSIRKIITMALVAIWGLRLSIHIFLRNMGKPEDYRYQEFRRNYGEKRYWWFSYFQVFLLQGTLVWLISAPLLAINYYSSDNSFGYLDVLGILVWLIGFTFEAGGDWQLNKFKANPANKGRLLQTGFWKYTRHPNYWRCSGLVGFCHFKRCFRKLYSCVKFGIDDMADYQGFRSCHVGTNNEKHKTRL